jgi:hypothetical protein
MRVCVCACVFVCVRERDTLTSAALPPQIESVNEVYGDVIMKHPDGPAVDAKPNRHSHRARGLVKPYWVRRLTYCDVRVGKYGHLRMRFLTGMPVAA